MLVLIEIIYTYLPVQKTARVMHMDGIASMIYLKDSLKGAINATRNKHRVASLLGKLKLSGHAKSLIFKYYGHSRFINENVHPAVAGSVQLQTIGKRLMEIQK